MPLAEGAQGSQRAIQWVKNRNNIIEMYMRKEVHAYRRQKDLNISLIDQDRLDIHDFLKDLRRCDSDLTPEAKTWLGERTPSGGRREPLKRISTAPAKVKIEETVQERDGQTAPVPKRGPPDEMEKYDFRFKDRQTPDLVRRSTTMCSIFNRRNELEGKASTVAPSEKGDDQSEMRPSSVTFQGTTYTKPCSAFSRDLESAFDAVKIDEERGTKSTKFDKHQRHNDNGDQQDFMKQLLVRKYQRKKKQKKPLNERIEEFFQQIDGSEVKQQDDD